MPTTITKSDHRPEVTPRLSYETLVHNSTANQAEERSTGLPLHSLCAVDLDCSAVPIFVLSLHQTEERQLPERCCYVVEHVVPSFWVMPIPNRTVSIFSSGKIRAFKWRRGGSLSSGEPKTADKGVWCLSGGHTEAAGCKQYLKECTGLQKKSCRGGRGRGTKRGY